MKNTFKSIIFTFLIFLILSCKRRNEIEGMWTHVKTTSENPEISRPVATTNWLKQILFLENGELQYYNDKHRFGMGYYYYQLNGDSLIWTNTEVDSIGGIDTLATIVLGYTIQGDTLKLRYGGKTTIYTKEG